MTSHHQHNLKKVLTVSLESKKLIPAEKAPLPQLDRGTDYESVRRGFESLTAHHLNAKPPSLSVAFYFLKFKFCQISQSRHNGIEDMKRPKRETIC